MQDCRAARLARVVNHQVAEAKKALRDSRGDRNVLYVSQGYVSRRARDEAAIHLYLRICERVTNRVAHEVFVGRNQKQRERKRYRNVNRNSHPRLPSEQSDERERAECRKRVAKLDE